MPCWRVPDISEICEIQQRRPLLAHVRGGLSRVGAGVLAFARCFAGAMDGRVPCDAASRAVWLLILA